MTVKQSLKNASCEGEKVQTARHEGNTIEIINVRLNSTERKV